MIARVSLIAVLACLPAAVAAAQTGPRPVETVAGMPPVVDPTNLYSEIRPNRLSPAVSGALPRIYVPNRQGNDVSVIDPATMKVVPGARNPLRSASSTGALNEHRTRKGPSRHSSRARGDPSPGTCA